MTVGIFYIIFFIISVVVTLVFSYGVLHIALKSKLISTKRFNEKHERVVALGGGAAIFISFLFLINLAWGFIIEDTSGILSKNLWGIILGGFVIMVGGVLDDRYNLKPHVQILFPIGAILIVIMSGVGIEHITNPIKPDELIYLDWWEKVALTFGGVPYHITFPGDVVSFIWLLLIMYATKMQDGLDGLVTGVSFIASIYIVLISYFVFFQFGLSLITILFAGTLLGFWFFNKYPAKMYLGEGGSVFTGFMLGCLAILSDAKVIITLLIIALPVFDVLWTIIRRVKKGTKPWEKDSEHLHHMLVKKGLSHKRTVWVLYILTAFFGTLVLLWQSSLTYYFLGFLLSIILIMLLLFRWAYSSKSHA